MTPLRSRRHEVADALEANELFQRNGWTDGLPIVNGPIRREIGMNARDNVLGNGHRPNATIGRAVRLVLMNVLGCVPGALDRSTLGQPGKFTLAIAEDEDDSPWMPLAEERGVPTGASAVTVLACAPPRQVMNEWTTDPEEILDTFAAEMRANMLTYSVWAGNYALLIPKQLRDLIAAVGWRKREIREYIHRAARVRRGDWRGAGKAKLTAGADDGREFSALQSPDDLLVVAAGGPAGGFGAVVRRRKLNMSAPAAPELLRELLACDAVVYAVGD